MTCRKLNRTFRSAVAKPILEQHWVGTYLGLTPCLLPCHCPPVLAPCCVFSRQTYQHKYSQVIKHVSLEQPEPEASTREAEFASFVEAYSLVPWDAVAIAFSTDEDTGIAAVFQRGSEGANVIAVRCLACSHALCTALIYDCYVIVLAFVDSQHIYAGLD